MKRFIKASSKTDPDTLIRSLVGQDKWVKAETCLFGTEQDNSVESGWWLYWLRILSIDEDGNCKVNYYNYDFPEQFVSLDDVGEVNIEDIDTWADTWGGILTTPELKDLIKQREEDHAKELSDYDDEYDEDEIEGCNVIASEDTNREFKAVPLKSLKKGAWFTIKPIAAPTDKQVYIKDDYDREEKKFMCGRCDDISYSTYFKGDKLVYDDNNFEY